MEENSGIYLIMNQINGKGYVGQAVNIEERWKQHKYRLNGQYHGNKHLQNAWNKYGKNNFVFIILEKCAKSVLDQAEIFWIKFLDTYKNGYNNTEGGDKNPMDYEECRKKVSQPGKKNGMYGKGYLVAGFNNGMYNKKHTDDAKIKMKFGKKNTNQTGILNVSCRKDGCNLYRYYDDNGKRQCISSMDLNKLKKKVLAQNLPWIVIDEEQAQKMFDKYTYEEKYTLWDKKYCYYQKSAMYRNGNNGKNPRRCFSCNYKGYKIPIGNQLDFYTCFLINRLIKE